MGAPIRPSVMLALSKAGLCYPEIEEYIGVGQWTVRRRTNAARKEGGIHLRDLKNRLDFGIHYFFSRYGAQLSEEEELICEGIRRYRLDELYQTTLGLITEEDICLPTNPGEELLYRVFEIHAIPFEGREELLSEAISKESIYGGFVEEHSEEDFNKAAFLPYVKDKVIRTARKAIIPEGLFDMDAYDKLLTNLSPTQEEILRLRFSEYRPTLDEVKDTMGYKDRRNVQGHEAKAIRALRHYAADLYACVDPSRISRRLHTLGNFSSNTQRLLTDYLTELYDAFEKYNIWTDTGEKSIDLLTISRNAKTRILDKGLLSIGDLTTRAKGELAEILGESVLASVEKALSGIGRGLAE